MKKLALNRETLITLGEARVAEVDGAVGNTFPYCAPYTQVVALCYCTKVLPRCIPVPGKRQQ